jgi:hypothetical protein
MLLLKIFLVPSLIGAVTLVGRRWGPAIAGWVAGFPIVAGPIMLLVAVEQGAAFAAVTAGGALAATIANVFFCLAYAWLATRFPWWACLTGGYIAFAIVASLLNMLSPSVHVLLVLAFAGIAAAAYAFPRNIDPAPLAPPPAIELPARMVAAALLVVAVTYLAPYLGPRLSGILAAPPLLASVLAGFSHPVSGAGFAIRLLQGMVSGFYALATFCFLLAFLLPAWGIAATFGMALACSIVVATLLLWIKQPSRFQKKAIRD